MTNAMRDFANATATLGNAMHAAHPDEDFIAGQEAAAREAFRKLLAEESATPSAG